MSPLDRLQQIVDATTAKPWLSFHRDLPVTVWSGDHATVGMYSAKNGLADAAFIATSRNVIDELIAVARAYQREKMWRGINCPACSMSDPSDGVPCYCGDLVNAIEDGDKALAALDKAIERETR